MNIRIVSALILLIAVSACGYNGGTTNIFASVHLYPENEAVDQPLDVEVAAVFDGEVDNVTDWSAGFTLKKDNQGDNLCTGYVFDDVENTAVCMHDALEPSSNYVTTLDGLPFGTSGGAAEWNTAAQ